MDIEKILNENEELLLQRIENLKQTIPGTDEDKDQLNAYDAIFKNHIALTKTYEEAVKCDSDESFESKKLDQAKLEFKEKIELEREKLKQEKELNEAKLKSEKELAEAKLKAESESVNKKIEVEREKLKSEKDVSEARLEIDRDKFNLDKILADKPKHEKIDLAIQAVGVIGAIVTPFACELIKQKMHWDVSKLVLNFEEHGAITSSIGKAEFRK